MSFFISMIQLLLYNNRRISMNFFDVFLKINFLTGCKVTIYTFKWFFPCMYHNMSFHVGSDCRFHFTFHYLGTKWTFKLIIATNRRRDFNWINLQNNQNNIFICKKKIIIFIEVFKKGDFFCFLAWQLVNFQMRSKIWFLIARKITIFTRKWFLSCVYHNVPFHRY